MLPHKLGEIDVVQFLNQISLNKCNALTATCLVYPHTIKVKFCNRAVFAKGRNYLSIVQLC